MKQDGRSLQDLEKCPPSPHHRPLAPNDNPPKASLLGLPAELRNEIYRWSLVVPNTITNNNGATLRQPALLRCCQQTRREGMSIFLAENTFAVFVRNHNWTLPTEHWLQCTPDERFKDRWGILQDNGGRGSWSNLKAWLKLHWAGKAPGLVPNLDNEDIANLLGIVSELPQDMECSKVEELLEHAKQLIEGHRQQPLFTD